MQTHTHTYSIIESVNQSNQTLETISKFIQNFGRFLQTIKGHLKYIIRSMFNYIVVIKSVKNIFEVGFRFCKGEVNNAERHSPVAFSSLLLCYALNQLDGNEIDSVNTT